MFRIYHEMRNQEHKGWFLTLTYDEKRVKRVGGKLSLRFYDVQLFLKSLRKAKYYAKYICVGEYGRQTKRPHYHLLIWTDCPIDKIEKIWNRGKVHVGALTMASAMYTLKYILQPVSKYEGVEKVRAQFSKRLGLSYLTIAVYNYHTMDEENPEWFSYIEGKKVALPRYYKNKIFTKHQCKVYANKIKWESIKKRRDKVRAFKAQGVKDANGYYKEIRTIQAVRIIQKTKVNQSL